MIPITPLADRTVLLSVGAIERIEECPETVIVLVGGRRLIVVDVAGDLARSIERVKARVMAKAAGRRTTAGEGQIISFPATQPPVPDGESGSVSEPTIATAAADSQTPHVSTVNNLHAGLVAFDRILGALARARWAIRQEAADADDSVREQLHAAGDTIAELMGSIDLERSGDIGSSLHDTLGHCAAQLSALIAEGDEPRDAKHTEATIRRGETALTKLRTIWARISADTSWSTPPPPSSNSTRPSNRPERDRHPGES